MKLLRQLIACKSMAIVSITSCVNYSRRCNIPCEARDPKGIEEIVRRESATKRRIEGRYPPLLG
jgi:hypothetical protein